MDVQRRARILLTLADRPHPPDGGKRRRSAATLAALASLEADLDVAVLTNDGPVLDPLPPGVQVAGVVQVAMHDRSKLAALAVTALRRVPFQVAVHGWSEVRRAVQGMQVGRYDLVWFGATDHAVSLGAAFPADRVVVDMDDVEVTKLRTYLRLPAGRNLRSRFTRVQRRIELPLWAGVQRRVLRSADAVLVCSELDRGRIGGQQNVFVVPNGYPGPTVPLPALPSAPVGAPTVLLVGTYSYEPNADAAVYAATLVLPLLRRLVPGVRLRLVGRGAEALPASVAAVEGVELVGAVEDIGPELARAQVSIAPVRYGGGTRIKILESFAHGVPVVSTTVGCEGIDVVHGEHLLVGDTPAELAQACAIVLRDPDRAERLRAAARDLLLRSYSPTTVDDAIRGVLLQVLPEVVPPRAQ